MLQKMFSGSVGVLTDSEGSIYFRFLFFFWNKIFSFLLGWILIDRSGTHFGTILNFLRDGSIPIPETTKVIAELLAEAKYYCIAELVESCELALMKKEREVEPICRVPLITSQREEQLLISTCTKVINCLIFKNVEPEKTVIFFFSQSLNSWSTAITTNIPIQILQMTIF